MDRGHPAIIFLLISFCSILIPPFITEHIKLISVADSFGFGCVFFFSQLSVMQNWVVLNFRLVPEEVW